MDFARKQLEKFGWKEGNGLGKNNQGMLQAIKPTLKTGKEGMGYDLSKELVDTWWTRAYDDSLNRLDIKNEEGGAVGVAMKEDEDDQPGHSTNSERPMDKMRKRMMKATFTTFSKGAILSNGEMLAETKSDSGDDGTDAKKEQISEVKMLTDEDLFRACGGRTAHKAARFGLKLNGKLARIAAQEEAAKALISNSKKSRNVSNSRGVQGGDRVVDTQESVDCLSRRSPSPDVDESERKKEKKKKKSKRNKVQEINKKESEDVEVNLPHIEAEVTTLEDLEPKKKKKKSKKRKYTELDDDNNLNSDNPLSLVVNNAENVNEEDSNVDKDDSIVNKKDKKKRKKMKKSRKNDEDEVPLL